MKTDLKALLKTTDEAIATLSQDRQELAADNTTDPAEIAENRRRIGLAAHTISNLNGVVANLRGLLGEPAAPVARKGGPTASGATTAPKKETGGASVPASQP